MKQAQPYRKGARRRQTPALGAMQRGKPATLRHPMAARRQAVKKRRKKGSQPHPLDRILRARKGFGRY